MNRRSSKGGKAPKIWLGVALSLTVVLMIYPTGAKAAYTLEQCIDKALKRSPEVKEARQEIEAVRAKKDEAHGHLFPTIEALGLFGPAPQARGNQVYSPDPVSQLHGLTIFGRLSAKIVQPIYTFGKIKFRERAAESGVQVKQAMVSQKTGDVILKIKKAYYGLLLGRVGKETVDEIQGFLDQARETLRRLLEIKSKNVSEVDQYKLEAYAGELKKYRNMTKKATNLAYDTLKTWVGVSPGEAFEIQDEALPMPELTLRAQKHYVNQAQELRPEFTQLDEGLRAKQLLVDAARADMFPSFFVTAFGSIAGAPERGRVKNPWIYDEYNHIYGGLAGGMKWEWDFGIKQAKVRGAKADLQKLRETQVFAQDNIPVQVNKAFLEVKEAWGNVQAFQRAYTEARKWLVAALSNFDLGLTPAKEVFDAMEKYALNRGEFLKALYDYNVALAELNHATGEYVRTRK